MSLLIVIGQQRRSTAERDKISSFGYTHNTDLTLHIRFLDNNKNIENPYPLSLENMTETIQMSCFI